MCFFWRNNSGIDGMANDRHDPRIVWICIALQVRAFFKVAELMFAMKY